MQFETGNHISANMSSLMGYVKANYFDLVETFGEPGGGDGYKVFNEWVVQFEDGTVATIYDWKEAGESVSQSALNYNWHIGGYNSSAVERVKEALSKACA